MDSEPPKVFISYNRADRDWAEWIAGTLGTADYKPIIQAWDFRPGENFALRMQQAAAEASITIAVLSEAYLKAEFTQPELRTAGTVLPMPPIPWTPTTEDCPVIPTLAPPASNFCFSPARSANRYK